LTAAIGQACKRYVPAACSRSSTIFSTMNALAMQTFIRELVRPPRPKNPKDASPEGFTCGPGLGSKRDVGEKQNRRDDHEQRAELATAGRAVAPDIRLQAGRPILGRKRRLWSRLCRQDIHVSIDSWLELESRLT
jgi:hypothetical protein